jgi:hypothetical protein
MKKYVMPTIETVEIKLSECIATLCDGCCPWTGWFEDKYGNPVYMTYESTSGV